MKIISFGGADMTKQGIYYVLFDGDYLIASGQTVRELMANMVLAVC